MSTIVKLSKETCGIGLAMVLIVISSATICELLTDRADATPLFDPVGTLAEAVRGSHTEIDLTSTEVLDLTNRQRAVFGIFPVHHLRAPLEDLIANWHIEAIKITGQDNLLSVYFTDEQDAMIGATKLRFGQQVAFNESETSIPGGWSWEVFGVTYAGREVATINYDPATEAWLTMVDSPERIPFSVMPIMKFMLRHGPSLADYFDQYEQSPDGAALFSGLIDSLEWFATTAQDNVLELVYGSPWLANLAVMAPSDFGGGINFRQMLTRVESLRIATTGMTVQHQDRQALAYKVNDKTMSFADTWGISPSGSQQFGLTGVYAGQLHGGKMRWATVTGARLHDRFLTLWGQRDSVFLERLIGRGRTQSVSETIAIR